MGIKDERGKLFYDYIRIVREKKPKFFLIENVAGMLTTEHRPAFDSILKMLSDLGYDVSYSLLNAADYIVPQDRFRVFIVGLRTDLKLKYTFPKPADTPQVTLRRAIGDITDEPNLSNGPIVQKISARGFWNHDVYTGPYSQTYMHSNRVRGWDEVSFTIQAQASNAPQHPQAPPMVFDPKGGRMFQKGSAHLYRRLSVRECARIQSFPDSFHFTYDDVKDGYKMVGNAVPPRLANALALQFLQAFGLTKEPVRNPRRHTVNMPRMAQKFPDFIVKNPTSSCIREQLAIDKNVLIGLVKLDNVGQFDTHSAKIYYTGKRFPSTVELNHLYYFMPYIKGKGIRDLYYIKVARVGSKTEVYPDCGDADLRIVFEIEYVTTLLNDYMPIRLNIWNTFSDTTMERLFVLLDNIKVSQQELACQIE